MQEGMETLKNIKILALDVDGVLTDGGIIIGNQGELCKRFNARDGLGISAALRHGLNIVLITGRHSEILLRRAKELGIVDVMENIKDKRNALESLCEKYEVALNEIAYMGDDLNDLPALTSAGFFASPFTASEDVKHRVNYVTKNFAGHGAVREVIELILKEQGIWDSIVSEYITAGQGDKQ